MSPELQLLIVTVLFLGLLMAGMAVPFAITIPALIYLLLQGGLPALNSLGLVSWGSMNSFVLTTVPLFMLMAEILSVSGLSNRIYGGLEKLVAKLPGGLLQTNIAGCAIFASVSGSSIATAASIGGVALPQLIARKYNRALAAGSLAAGGTLGILIPPSFPMIIYGTFTETSVPKLFIAGIIPGYFGVVTTTEAAVIGCVLSILLGATLGELSLQRFVQAMHNTIYFSGNILFLILAAYIFSVALSFGGVGEKVTEFIVGLHLSKFEFYIALFVLFTILGCLIESLGMIVITVPLLFPVLNSYGIDPILFGVVLVIFIELGQISPPIGINLFVIQSIWDGKLSEVVIGTIPFHLIMFVVLGLVIFWPELALWLPARMSN